MDCAWLLREEECESLFDKYVSILKQNVSFAFVSRVLIANTGTCKTIIHVEIKLRTQTLINSKMIVYLYLMWCVINLGYLHTYANIALM